MSEPPIKRFFIAVDMKANSYTIIDRQTGEVVITVHDPKTAAEYCAIRNQRSEKDRAFLDALARASGAADVIHQAAAVFLIGVMAGHVTGQLVHAPAQTGSAAHYKKGMMERVSRNRGLPIVACMIAADAPIGRWYTVVSRVNGQRRSCRVTDVPHPRDRARLARRGIIVEFDFRSGMAMCALEYYGQEPPERCRVTVTRR